jgi:phosphohistidine phosphatase SixA
MRELILLRHAHAEMPASGQDDAERALSAEGQAAAEAVGRWLLEHGKVPDCVLTSPARRTLETLEGVVGVIGHVPHRVEPDIYEATPGALIDLVDRHKEIGRLMVVGHNPGLERLVALMESGQSGDYRGMPPAGVAVLTLPPDAPMEPGVAELVQFWWP